MNWIGTTDSFPYFTGVLSIVASWLISPVCSAIVSIILFLSIYHGILKNESLVSRNRSLATFPLFVGVTVAVGLTFILANGAKSITFAYKGNKNASILDVLGGFWGTLGVSVAVGLLVGVLLRIYFVPYLKTRMEKVANSIDINHGEEHVALLAGECNIKLPL